MKTILGLSLPLFFIVTVFAGCHKRGARVEKKTSSQLNHDELVERGRRVYGSSCASCHNANPKIDGILGPAIFGATKELLERKVIHGDYPPGVAPKRSTKAMQPLPWLRNDLPALHAFLNHDPHAAKESTSSHGAVHKERENE